MNEIQAQELHDQRKVDDPEHDRCSCWCCCLDCDFDFEAVTRNDNNSRDNSE